MAVPDKVLHYLTIDSKKYGVILPDTYANIDTVVGVSKGSATTEVDYSTSSNELLRNGNAVKIKVRYPDGAKVRTATILCDISKAKSAPAGLVGKTFRTGAIKSAYFPRRARLG